MKTIYKVSPGKTSISPLKIDSMKESLRKSVFPGILKKNKIQVKNTHYFLKEKDAKRFIINYLKLKVQESELILETWKKALEEWERK